MICVKVSPWITLGNDHVVRFAVQMSICTIYTLPFNTCLELQYLLYMQIQCIVGCRKVITAQCESQ